MSVYNLGHIVGDVGQKVKDDGACVILQLVSRQLGAVSGDIVLDPGRGNIVGVLVAVRGQSRQTREVGEQRSIGGFSWKNTLEGRSENLDTCVLNGLSWSIDDICIYQSQLGQSWAALKNESQAIVCHTHVLDFQLPKLRWSWR